MAKTIMIVGLLIAIVTLSVILLKLLKQQQEAAMGGGRPSDKKSSARRHWLLGISGEVEGKTFHIGERAATIGRAASNFIQISHADASRVHCQLKSKGDMLEVTDMNSRNHTLVNNEQIKEQMLFDGDLLTVANCVFEYKEEGEFDFNDAFARKNVDSNSIRPTMMGQDNQPVEELVMRALEKTDGDVIKAAQLTKVRVDIVEKCAEKWKRR